LDEAQMRRVRDCVIRSGSAPLEYYRAMFRIGPNLSRRLRELTASIEVPTLYLHGERDGCIGAETVQGQQSFFSAPFDQEFFANAGHFLHLEAPQPVIAATLHWLRLYPPHASDR